MSFFDDLNQQPAAPLPEIDAPFDEFRAIRQASSGEESRAALSFLQSLLDGMARQRFTDADGNVWEIVGLPIGTGTTKEFQIETKGETKWQIFGGTVYGLGLNARVPSNLILDDWKEGSGSSGQFLLKFILKPEKEQRPFYVSGETVQTKWAIASGGTILTCQFEFVAGTEIPAAVLPSVDPDTGTETNGTFYLRLGSIAGRIVTQSVTGPVIVGFCAPSSFWFKRY